MGRVICGVSVAYIVHTGVHNSTYLVEHFDSVPSVTRHGLLVPDSLKHASACERPVGKRRKSERDAN